MNRLRSPCVGICSTAIGDVVCRGCKRFVHEIIAWNGYSEPQRRCVLTRLDQLLAQVVGARCDLVDPTALRRALERYRLDAEPGRDPLCQIQELLRAAASRIRTPAQCGFRPRPDFAGLPLTQLRDDIERQFWHLSMAHFDRYLAPGIVVETRVDHRARGIAHEAGPREPR